MKNLFFPFLSLILLVGCTPESEEQAQVYNIVTGATGSVKEGVLVMVGQGGKRIKFTNQNKDSKAVAFISAGTFTAVDMFSTTKVINGINSCSGDISSIIKPFAIEYLSKNDFAGYTRCLVPKSYGLDYS